MSKTNSKSIKSKALRSELQRLKQHAVEVAGGARALGQKLGVSGPAVSQWDIIPPRRVPEIAKVTGLKPWQLRPDLHEETP